MPKLTKDQAKNKVYELTKRLFEIEKLKKTSARDFKDQQNDVLSEIHAIYEEQEDQNTAGTTP